MSAVYDTDIKTLTVDGTTTVDLVQGETYLLGVAGAFGSGGSLTFAFVDADGNAVTVPTVGEIDGAGNPLTVTTTTIVEIVALTALLRLILASSTSPSIDVTITLKKR